MHFEFDPIKSDANKIKHGIDFEEAQVLWLDNMRIEIDARSIGEKRVLLIGLIENEIWSAIYTMRRNTIRIISVRKSRANEKDIYYNERI